MMSGSSFTGRRKSVVIVVLVSVILLTDAGFRYQDGKGLMEGVFSNADNIHRKLLHRAAPKKKKVQKEEPTRIGADTNPCSESDLVLFQGPTDPLPSGIPTYTVQIVNACSSGCNIAGIHLKCGWFSSARLIDPSIFRRITYDDCLVNDGQPILNGQSVSFQYANTYSYDLSISSMRCL